jgi:hypothetical protein
VLVSHFSVQHRQFLPTVTDFVTLLHQVELQLMSTLNWNLQVKTQFFDVLPFFQHLGFIFSTDCTQKLN